MDERSLEIEEVFHAALSLGADQRAAFLANKCGSDEALRREVESLLAYKERTQSPLQTPVVDQALRALVESDGESLIGKTVSHYQILSRIGEGGMGVVYAALDQRLNRKVALKFLPASFIEDEEQVRHLHREARAASAFHHPNIVTIYEFGQADSQQFIAMELVEGVTLRQKMSAQMPFHEILNIAIQVASGLAAAHQAGVLHRDIKPENVMFGKDGFVKVLDFGIAKFKEQQGPAEIASAVNTEASVAGGTLSYMSPEQARGELLDARTDIFSLGILLFEMITGQKPFSGDNQTEMLRSLLDDEAPSLSAHRPDVPPDLQRIVGKALKKNREDRYQTARELLADLREFDRAAGREMDETQRANRMLRQYLSIYAVDKRALIPIMKLPFIRRYSDLERGERTRELLKKSLRWGLIKASLILVSLLLVTTVAAAMLSRREEWTGIRLSDGHTAAVRRAVFSPDGHLLVSVGEDKKVIVWDFARRERLATLAGQTDWVTSVDFSPDGRWFATGSRDTTVIVWDATRLQQVAILREHQGPVNAVAFSPDGRVLASASESPDSRTILWEVGQWQKTLELPVGSVYPNLIFSPNGHWISVQNPDNGATWEVATGRPVSVSPDQIWGGNWSAVAPDGKRAASISSGGVAVFLDVHEFWDEKRSKVLAQIRAHQDNGRAVAYSPDGRIVATGADDIVLWEAATQTKFTHLKHTSVVWGLAFSPNGRWLVSTHGDGAILVWDVAERELAANLNEHSAPVRSVAFSADGKHVASASEDRSIIIWDADHQSKEKVLIGHTTRITGLAFSPDGKWIASCDLHGTHILWDVQQGQSHLVFKTREWDTYGLAISPDGRRVATSSGIYDSSTGLPALEFEGSVEGTTYGVAFSPEGSSLASVTDYGRIYLWDTSNWRLLDHVGFTDTQFISVSFSHDGKRLVTGDDEGRVRLWSVNPLREIALIGHHASRIKSVAFSPDGSEVVSAGDDRNIYLWDVSARKLITSIGTHTAPVLSVAFSPDGKKLVAGGHDNSVRIFTRHRTLWGYKLG